MGCELHRGFRRRCATIGARLCSWVVNSRLNAVERAVARNEERLIVCEIIYDNLSVVAPRVAPRTPRGDSP